METTSLFRSRYDAFLGGVCGGLGIHLGVSSTLVRLCFVLLALSGRGIGLPIYLLLWLVMPLEGWRGRLSLGETVRTGSQEIAARTRGLGADLYHRIPDTQVEAAEIMGASLVILGLVYLLQSLDIPYLRWLTVDVLWPLLLIGGGLALLLRRSKGYE